MNKRSAILVIITSIIILLPILAGLALWEKLPSQLPIHWNIKGKIDGLCPKEIAVFGLPAILLVLHWISLAFAKKRSDEVGAVSYWIIPVVAVIISTVMYYFAMR